MNSFFKILKQSLIDISKNKFDYLFFFYNLVFFVGGFKLLLSDEALIFNFFIVLFFTLIKGKITFKGLPVILSLFTLIVFLPTFYWGFSGGIIYIGFYLRILTAILMILYFRVKFFIIFENIMFIMALISLPLFLIQIVDVEFFNIFKGFSESVLNDEVLTGGFGKLSSHRYLIIFLVNSWAENRNSGFAWEPAGFGALLLWASLINLSIYKMKLNVKLIVFFFTAITTFSLGTYSTFAVLVLYYFFNLKVIRGINLLAATAVFLLFIFSFTFFSGMNLFMKSKTEVYVKSVENEKYKAKKSGNRVQGALNGMTLLIKSPVGYGLAPEEKTGFFLSANGFFNILYKYGFIGGILMVLLIFNIHKFLKLTFYDQTKGKYFFLLILILTFNGNPFYHQPFFLAFLLSGYLLNKIYYGKDSKSELSKRGIVIPVKS
jgi:hypothetical protein